MPPRARRGGGDICAIFVHAGAGFHSYSNEKIHLSACQDACRVAMTILRNGGEAVDAVEMAIKVLEDREITNAGFGSNLAMDGTVECDATIVDHMGRSGACGAVAQIKNPISLARLILQESTQPLSLQRVPPNLLVGQGATDFAYDHHMPVLPHDFLISTGARDRWMRWRHDLIAVDEEQGKIRRNMSKHAQDIETADQLSPPVSPVTPKHALAIQSQPELEAIGTSLRPLAESAADIPGNMTNGSECGYGVIPLNGHMAYTPPSRDPMIDGSNTRYGFSNPTFDAAVDSRIEGSAKRVRLNRPQFTSTTYGKKPTTATPRNGNAATEFHDGVDEAKVDEADERKDHIVDTVGAIAVDCFGNIAAGSSSGGIGMKHRGRTGPAALVGIGTAVVPMDAEDPSHTSVASVTSGTGEHMATTMAASTCSERIYSRVRRKPGGGLEYAAEEESMRTMIEKEFMEHPGVKNSNCTGAIGIMTVKKTADGVFLYFAHNTDSFAIASMHSEEKKPVSVMSRSTGNGAIAQGGRLAKYRKRG